MKKFLLIALTLIHLTTGFPAVSNAEEDTKKIENLLSEVESLQGKSETGRRISNAPDKSPPPAPATEKNFYKSLQEDYAKADKAFRGAMNAWRGNHLDKAINLFVESIKYRPTDANAYWNLGLIYDQKSNGAEAIQNMENAEKIFANFNRGDEAGQARKFLRKFIVRYGYKSGDSE